MEVYKIEGYIKCKSEEELDMLGDDKKRVPSLNLNFNLTNVLESLGFERIAEEFWEIVDDASGAIFRYYVNEDVIRELYDDGHGDTKIVSSMTLGTFIDGAFGGNR